MSEKVHFLSFLVLNYSHEPVYARLLNIHLEFYDNIVIEPSLIRGNMKKIIYATCANKVPQRAIFSVIVIFVKVCKK